MKVGEDWVAARPIWAKAARPIQVESVAQFEGKLNEVGRQLAVGDEINHSQQQERLVRRAMLCFRRPACAVVISVQTGKAGAIVIQWQPSGSHGIVRVSSAIIGAGRTPANT